MGNSFLGFGVTSHLQSKVSPYFFNTFTVAGARSTIHAADLVDGGSLEDAQEELLQAGASFHGHVDRATRSLKRALGAISDMDEPSRREGAPVLDRVSKLVDQVRTLLLEGIK
jgi:hypothetical protein